MIPQLNPTSPTKPNYKPVIEKLIQAVCPTCKDRVSQRMGYARMAEESFHKHLSELTIHTQK